MVTGLGLATRLQRIAQLTPSLHSAIQRHRVQKTHLAQCRCREGRDVAQFAAGEDAPGGIGQILVDAQLELTSREQPCTRNVTALVGVPLAHVEHYQVVLRSLDARLEFGKRHERYGRGGLGE